VACPYFLPVMPHQSDAWATPPRVPLGVVYSGVCCASEARIEPNEDALRSFCNNGYAKGGCSHFPIDAECDAMRYSIATATEVKVEIQFILEKNHAPLRHGRAEYSIERSEFSGLEGIALAQGRAFIESYLRRTLAV
jgi:hypothetical protein